jgi:PST family polysaccharide transporter
MTDQLNEPMLGEATSAPQTKVGPSRSRLMGKAALWSGMNSFVLRLGQFAIGVVVARLIDPRQFGVFAVAITVQTVIVNVSELGVSAALVRAKEDVDAVARAVALVSIMSSAVLTAAMYLTAPSLASLLGASEAAGAIRILSFTVLLAGLGAVPYALLVRDFRQDKRFAADTSNFAVSSVTVVVFALAGLGANALALSRLLGQLMNVILLFVMVRPLYLPEWNWPVMRRVLRFSLPLAGADVVGFSLNNADYVVIGRILGALPLGFYMLAYNISGWPVSVLGLMINEVALPAFAQTRDDRRGLPRRVMGAMSITGAIAFPISALIFALAHPLVVFVYGSKWNEAADVLGVLALFGSIRIMLVLLMNIQAALGHSRAVLAVQLTWLIALVPALVLGVRMDGIFGAAVAQEAVGLLIVIPLAVILVSRAGGGSLSSLLGSLVLPLLGGVVVGLTAWGVSQPFGHPGAQLLIGGFAGIAVYLLVFGPWVRDLLRHSARQWDTDGEDTLRAGRHRASGQRTARRAVQPSIGR